MRRDGFSLIELITVTAVIAIAIGVTAPAIFEVLSPENRVKAHISGLYTDIAFAQNEAMRQGAYGIIYDDPISGTGGGTLRQRRVYLVFESPSGYANSPTDTKATKYRIWRWEDLDGDNTVELGEFDPNMAGGADAPVKTVDMDSRLYFGFDNDGGSNDVDKTACGNNVGTPSPVVTYGEDSLPKCLDDNCTSIELDDMRNIEFDQNGFTGFPGAVYLTNGKYSYAVSGNSAGIFNMCAWKWNAVDSDWEWLPMR